MAWITLEKETTITFGDGKPLDANVEADVEVTVIKGRGGDGRYIPPDPDEVHVEDAGLLITFYDQSEIYREIEMTGVTAFDMFWSEEWDEVREKAFEAARDE